MSDPDVESDLPTPAMGADTVMAVTARAAHLGYRGSTSTTGAGHMRCDSCDTSFDAATYDVDYQHRLEGASDVADSMLLVAGTCPACGVRSTLLVGYGPNASAADADALSALDLTDSNPLPPEV